VRADREALARCRLQQAEESLSSARLLLDHLDCRAAVNRAYYTMFYGVLALLAAGGRGTSKHSGAIALFDSDFVRKGIFRSDLSAWLHQTFDLRLQADYGEMFQVKPKKALTAIARAEQFLSAVRTELEARFGRREES